MKRKYLYRAQSVENDAFFGIKKGQWVYGSLMFDELQNDYVIQNTKGEDIISTNVKKSTICEYSNQNDVDGVPIYEFDIVAFPFEGETAVAFVKLCDGAYRLFEKLNQKWSTEILDRESIEILKYKVVGNIFDDKELTEVFKS